MAVFSIGIWSNIESKYWHSLLGDDETIANIAKILIAAGSFATIAGFFGCFGAIRENKSLLFKVFLSGSSIH